VWTEGKEIAKTMLEPAKDVMAILDVVAVYMPMILAAKAVFTVSARFRVVFSRAVLMSVCTGKAIVKVELERHENDKNVVSAKFPL